MKERFFLIILLLASLAIKIPLAISISSFGVDESIYLSTAREFVETGTFGINRDVYDFRFISPLFPAIASVFYYIGGQNAVLFVSPVFSSLVVIVFYFLGKSISNESTGRIAALIGFFSSVAILASSRPLTESTALFFFSLSMLLMYLAVEKKTKLAALLLPVSFVLTFMSRFQYGGIFLLIFIAYLLLSSGYKKINWNRFGFGILAALLITSPWLIFNYQSFGNPIGGPAHQATGDLGFDPRAAVMYFPYALIVMGFAAPFVLWGSYMSFKSRVFLRKNIFLFVALVGVFVVQFFIFGKVAEERYLLPILPAVSVLGGIGLSKVSKKWSKVASCIFIGLMVTGFLAGVYGALYLKDYPRYNETKDAVEFVKENCRSPVMGNSFTHVWYYADYVNVPLSQDRAGIDSAKTRGVECIIVSLYETPFRDDLKDSSLVKKVFESGKVSVYRIL